VERLRKVAALVAVLSPRYVKSEWTLRELTEFWRAAELSTGIRIGDKARVFKILKTPVPLEKHPPQLQSLLGYEFFKVDPETGNVRELDLMFGAEAQTEFLKRVDDVARDLCELVQAIECGEVPETVGKPPVYLAEATRDLTDAHDSIRRDLQDQLVKDGYPVRVYVPFGTQWYPYFMRRLAERPANVWFFISNFFR